MLLDVPRGPAMLSGGTAGPAAASSGGSSSRVEIRPLPPSRRAAALQRTPQQAGRWGQAGAFLSQPKCNHPEAPPLLQQPPSGSTTAHLRGQVPPTPLRTITPSCTFDSSTP